MRLTFHVALFIAFTLSASAQGETPLLEALLAYLRTLPELGVPAVGAEDVFRHWVGGATGASGGVDGPQLRALTAEALAWSVWVKRAAEAHQRETPRVVPSGSEAFTTTRSRQHKGFSWLQIP